MHCKIYYCYYYYDSDCTIAQYCTVCPECEGSAVCACHQLAQSEVHAYHTIDYISNMFKYKTLQEMDQNILYS